MSLPTSFYGQTINDNTLKPSGNPETGNWQVPVTTLTAANYVAKKALIDALAAAVAAIRIGNTAITTVTIERLVSGSGPAASPLAQRENKLLIRYHDITTLQKYQVSIPTFDLTLLAGNSEFLALGAGVGAALKSAFEAIVVAPGDATHSVIMDSAQFVGRSV